MSIFVQCSLLGYKIKLVSQYVYQSKYVNILLLKVEDSLSVDIHRDQEVKET